MEEKLIDMNFEILKVVDSIAPHKVKIDTELADRKKAVENEYVALKIRSDEHIFKIYKTKPKNRTDAEKDELKCWMKSTRKEFKALKSFLYPMNPLSNPAEALTQKIKLITSMLRYIEVSDFDDAMKRAGIELNTKSMEETSPFWASNTNRELAKDIMLSQAREISVAEINENVAIKEVGYGELPENIVYSPDNRSGLTVSQFVNLVKTKAASIIQDNERYSAYKRNVLEKTKGTIGSSKVVYDITEEI